MAQTLLALSTYAQQGFNYIAEVGKVVIPYGVEVAKLFADPDKGFFISLAGYYALSILQIRAEDVAKHIDNLATSVEQWDPVSGYEAWIRNIVVLGERPIWDLFNPAVAWEQIEQIEALKPLSCGALDFQCHLANVGKMIARVMLIPVFFIRNLVLTVSYYIFAGLVTLGKWIAVGFLRYIAKPIVTVIITIYDAIRNFLRTVFCYYIKIAPFATAGKELVKGKGTLGRKILKGFAKFLGYTILTSLIARECVLIPVTTEITAPAPVPVVPTPTPPPVTASGTVFIVSTETAGVIKPVGYVATATVTVNAIETINATTGAIVESITITTSAIKGVISIIVSEIYIASADISANATENINVTVLGKVTGSATASLNATENINVTVQQASSEQVPVPTSPTIASADVLAITVFSGSATISLNATENVRASLASSGLAQASAIVASANISTTVS